MKKFISAFLHQPCWFLVLALLTSSSYKTFAQLNKSSASAYGTASYKGINAGKYLRNWLIAGPFTMDTAGGVTMEAQEKFFNEDPITSVSFQKGEPLPAGLKNGRVAKWQSSNEKEDIIDFDSTFHKADYAAAYAVAEVVADSAMQVLLAVGSDDGLKVWLNGKAVHKNWIARGIVADQDIIPVTLVKGSNQLLVKVQDMQGRWGFEARFLDKAAVTQRFVVAAGNGDIDDINMLLSAGASINGKGSTGMTALTAARVHGREEIVKLLLQKGAKNEAIPAPGLLLDGIYASLSGKQVPGIAVLVAQDGKIVYKKAFGYADIENKAIVTPDTKFRIGSITKQFTASAILKLQEAGLLNVSDKLSKYIPDFPRGDQVTLHHLLTHTSGIHSFTANEDFLDKVIHPIKWEDLVNNIKKDSFDFNPGEQWRYNNSGYFLLGYIIEKVTGKSYGQYLKETFFDPLQMNNTGIHTSLLKLTNEAKGYTKTNGEIVKALNWDMSWAGGAGNLYSTVEDLYKWNEAVFGGKVLSEASLKTALTPALLNNGKKPEGVEYGYGWGIGKYRGLQVIEHSGGLHGFLSQLARFPAEHLTVVMLTNEAPAEAELNPHTIGELYLSAKMEKQSSYSAATLQQDVKVYEGRYDFQNGAVMTITSEGNDLFAQLSGQAKYPIFPSAPGEFFWKVVEAKIKFSKDEKGEVTGAQFFQNGGEIHVPKIKEEVIVKVDPALYKDYIGNYDLGNKLIISVTADKEKLYAMAAGEQKYEILPTSDTTFVLKELNAKLTFYREPGGSVSKLIVDMAGQKRDAPKLQNGVVK